MRHPGGHAEVVIVTLDEAGARADDLENTVAVSACPN